MRFRKNPIEFEAVQFTGDNWDEMREFTGVRIAPHDGHVINIFNPLGTFLPTHLYDQVVDDKPIPTAELWVDANHKWLPIVIGEWVIKDQLGFYPCKDEIMQMNNTPVDAECTCEAPTFGQEIVHLLNKHNMERYSGTPDWILGNFLEMVLRQFDCAVMMRADWRGESTELPALQTLREDQIQIERTVEQINKLVELGIVHVDQPLEHTDLYRELTGNKNKKKVPLVTYDTKGQRNEIGEAEIQVTADEVLVTGTITGVVPMFDLTLNVGPFTETKQPSPYGIL